MGIVSKLTDALSMFWQALDDEERRVVVYVGIYLVVSLAVGLQAKASESRERRLREEVQAILAERH